jgi:caffeoyl-CoA O-methyltransferase
MPRRGHSRPAGPPNERCDERAPAHPTSPDYAVSRFAEDPGFLSGVVQFGLPLLGDISGLRGVHLPLEAGVTGGPSPVNVGRVATGTEHVSSQILDYVVAHTSQPDPLLSNLRAETARRFPGSVVLQIGPEQGTFMTLLSRIIAPRRAIEVGTFTGYSAICLARGLAPGGRLLCCDVSAEWTSLAQEYWQQAGLADAIQLSLGPAIDTLRALPEDTSFDLAFIDADKTGYASYWDEIVPRTRSGGVILVDNTFLHGRIFDADPDPDGRAIRDFNEYVLADDRVELAMLSIGDGLTLARKK